MGTRLSFRLIYPDTRNQAIAADGRGRYLSKDMGSVVIGASGSDAGARRGSARSTSDAGKQPMPGGNKLQGEDADKTLQDARFVIGDYVDCAILPPLSDGSIAPAPTSRGSMGGSAIGGGMRAFGGGPSRENGFGRPRLGVPSGEWRRGERIPEGGGRGYNWGPGRGRGRPY